MVAPGNVRVNVVNSTLAEVHWDPVPLKSIRGHLQGYRASERSFFCNLSVGTSPQQMLDALLLVVDLENSSGLLPQTSQVSRTLARAEAKPHCIQVGAKKEPVFSLFPTGNLKFFQLNNNGGTKWGKLVFKK